MPWKSLILWSWYWQRSVIQSICRVREWRFFTENLKKLKTTIVHSQSYEGFAKITSNSLHLHSRIAGTIVKVTRIKYRALYIWRPVEVISPTWRTNLYIILQDDENLKIIFCSKNEVVNNPSKMEQHRMSAAAALYQLWSGYGHDLDTERLCNHKNMMQKLTFCDVPL